VARRAKGAGALLSRRSPSPPSPPRLPLSFRHPRRLPVSAPFTASLVSRCQSLSVVYSRRDSLVPGHPCSFNPDQCAARHAGRSVRWRPRRGDAGCVTWSIRILWERDSELRPEAVGRRSGGLKRWVGTVTARGTFCYEAPRPASPLQPARPAAAAPSLCFCSIAFQIDSLLPADHFAGCFFFLPSSARAPEADWAPAARQRRRMPTVAQTASCRGVVPCIKSPRRWRHQALQASPAASAGLPARIHSLRFCRSGPVAGYGRHVINAYMRRAIRSSPSTLVFYRKPDAYKRGELVLEFSPW